MTTLAPNQPWQRKEVIGGCTLLLGDCLDIIPMLGKVDAVVTDPPYGMQFVSGHRHIKHSAIMGDDYLPLEHINLSIQLSRRFAYVFCRWDNLGEMPSPTSVLAWVKNNWSMGDLKHEHGRQWEAICFYARADHEFTKRIPDVIYAPRTGNNLHPTQKPIMLIEQLIRANVVDIILDPFMGSGTTGVACVNLGRKFIGIEIEPKYFDIACKRIDQAERQGRLFEPKPQTEQLKI